MLDIILYDLAFVVVMVALLLGVGFVVLIIRSLLGKGPLD